MTQHTVTDDINAASEHVAAELLRITEEMEILHIPSDLGIEKLSRVFPDYYGSAFHPEAIELARRLVLDKFSDRESSVTTSEVRETIREAVETRNRAMHVATYGETNEVREN